MLVISSQLTLITAAVLNLTRSRIGIRILIGHYLAVRDHTGDAGWVGLVYDNTSPASVAEQAIHDATFVCERQCECDVFYTGFNS